MRVTQKRSSSSPLTLIPVGMMSKELFTNLYIKISKEFFSIMTKVLKNNSTSVKHVFHISDIHIRQSDDRHYEYKQVFQQLYKQIKSEASNNSVTVLCGDILHAKCNYNEISLQILFEFLESLANITDLIIIMGNHDGSTLNNNKRDALSVVVDRVNSKNDVYYLRDSGSYIYNNVVFGVSSVYDNGFIKASSITETDKIKIALYHGSVSSSTLQNGFLIEQYDRKIEEFDGYDYVMLGDIHKFQELRHNACYSSSLIQQNFGEELYNHGYILWDLENGSYSFNKVPNDYGFVTVKIDNGVVVSQPDMYPKYSKVRVQYINTDKSTCINIINRLQKNKIFKSVTYDQIHSKINNSLTTKVDNVKDSINKPEYQNKLIKTYYSKIFTKDELDSVVAINNYINKLCNVDTSSRCTVRWKPLNLKFSNMFIYGTDNEVDFTKLHGVTGIIGKNDYGKSSLLDVLLYTLYEKCTKKNILNLRKKQFGCCLEFKVGDETYKIIRLSKRTRKEVAKKIVVDVEFYKKINNEYRCISGKDKTETNRMIISYVGSYDDFIMSYVHLQNCDKDDLIKLPPCKKIDYLIKLTGVEIYDVLRKEARKILNDKKAVQKRVENSMMETDIGSIKVDKKKYVTDAKLLKQQMIETEDDIRNMSDEINCLYKSFQDVQTSISGSLSELENERKKIADKMDNSVTDTDTNDSEKQIKQMLKSKLIVNSVQYVDAKDISSISKYVQKLNKYRRLLTEIDTVHTPFHQHNTVQAQLIDCTEHKHRLVELNAEIKYVNSTLEQFKNFKYDPECKYCINNPFTKKAQNTVNKKKELVQEKEQLVNMLDIYEKDNLLINYANQISSCNNVVKEHSMLITDLSNHIEHSVANIDIYISELKFKINTLTEQRKQYLDSVDSMNHNRKMDVQIALLEKYIKKVQKYMKDSVVTLDEYDRHIENSKLQNQIDSLEKDKKEAESKLHNMRLKYNKYKLCIHDADKTIKNYETLSLENRRYEKEIKDYNNYLSVTERNGVPYKLIENVIQCIQDKANQILSSFSSFTLDITRTYKKDDSSHRIEIDKIVEGKKLSIENCCGSDKFLAGFAVRLAVTDIYDNSVPNFMAIDEGFSCLDTTKINNIDTIFDKLKEKFDFILIISHLTTLNDCSNSYICITKDSDGYSYVKN